jgi:hypothetical protein
MADDPSSTAFDPRAPEDERTDAHAQLTKAHMPTASDLMPPSQVREVIQYIQNEYEESRLAKALGGGNVIQFPAKKPRARGMQSVWLDDLQIFAVGDWYEKSAPLGFETLRRMVDQTPVLSAIVLTRIRQALRFTQAQQADGPGFRIMHIDKDHELDQTEEDSVHMLTRFFEHSGWEHRPRARKALRRDNFSQFVSKLVRDFLILDAGSIETERKRDRRLGIDGFYAVDGATIRLCTEEGYAGDDQVFALQVVQNQIRTAYTFEDLIYEPRNPRTDVRLAGYGMSETELLVRITTGWLNALTYNIRGFDENSIPKGILHLSGDYSNEDLVAFKRYWNAMTRGVNNAWSVPVMVSKDQESKVGFEPINTQFNEMYFAKWMTFLTSLSCAIYGMSPSEINFDSFTGGNTSALSGSDTEEKLASSKDLGLRPLMAHLESTFSDFIVADMSEKYVFRWTGLDEEDQNRLFERQKLGMTVNEIRAIDDLPPLEGPMGDAPINPSLVGVWSQMQQGQQENDFGVMPAEGDDAPAGDDREGDFGGEDQQNGADQQGRAQAGGRDGDFGKALRIYSFD